MKKNLFLFFLLLSIVFLPACFRKEVKDMAKPGADGKYHYENKDLGFAVALPKEFEYYQVQRKVGANYTDLEIFVPTADPDYINRDFPSYAQPLVFRISNAAKWEEVSRETPGFSKIGEKENWVYAVKFWDKTPSDWSGKWSEEMKKEIEAGFSVLD